MCWSPAPPCSKGASRKAISRRSRRCATPRRWRAGKQLSRFLAPAALAGYLFRFPYIRTRGRDFGPHRVGVLGERDGRGIVLPCLGAIARLFGGARGAERGTEPMRFFL